MASLSVREVAERARTSDRTVRRWIAEGKLAATRTADGWTVDESDLAALLDGRTSTDGQLDGQPHGRPTTTDGHRGRPSDEAPHLAALVRDLQRQNLELAGLVGSLQQRLVFAEDRIRALEAPTADQEADPAAQEPNLREIGQTPAQEPSAPRRPWWAFWRA
jgi:excisionase family DNA binding protein